MAKAASHLGIAQPSVSEAIAALEHAVGFKLLDRNPRGVQPTRYGEALLHRSHAAFDELRQGIRDIEFLADPTIGEFSIACPESLTAGFVPEVIDRLHSNYPRLVFNVVQANTITLEFAELRERRVDLALARLTETLSDDELDLEVLFQDRLLVVVGLNHHLARRRKIKLSDLMHERWIATPLGSSASLFAAEAFQKDGLSQPGTVVQSYSQHLRFLLLETGNYVTTMPESVLRYNVGRIAIRSLPVDLKLPERPVAIVTLKNRTLSPIANLFIDCARDVAKGFKRRQSKGTVRQ